MLTKLKFCVALATTIGFASVAQGNLLTNPGFESGDFSGWTVAGTNGGSGVNVDGSLIPGTDFPFSPAVVNVRSGSYAAYGVTADTAGEFLSLSQNVWLGGGNYSAGFFMGNDSQSEFGIDFAIDDGRLAILLDSTVIPFTIRYPVNNFPTGSTPSDMYEFGVSFSTGAGSHNIEYRISGSGTARAGISVDDFYLNGAGASIPEPGTLALLGFGLAGLAATRRRRQ